MSETQVLINYWARNGYWKQLQNVCNDALKKRGDDPVLIFWKAFGILNEGNIITIVTHDRGNVRGNQRI